MPHTADYRDISALEPYFTGGIIGKSQLLRRADHVLGACAEDLGDLLGRNVFISAEDESLMLGREMRKINSVLSELG